MPESVDEKKPSSEDAKRAIEGSTSVEAAGETKVPNLEAGAHQQYRLYKRRWAGVVALVLLNIASAMNWLWFSAIALATAQEFNITLQQVNWLANSINLIYLPVAFLFPYMTSRFNIRVTCFIGAGSLLLASWIRYAGTASGLSPGGSYALLFIGQVFAGISQPIFQVIAPKYSELWFDLRGRTTATMIVAIANPIGSALAQLVPPLIGQVRFNVLILGIITTACVPSVFLIGASPPTPPTYSGSITPPPMKELLLGFLGRGPRKDTILRQERIDLCILVALFSTIVAGTTTFTIFINQIFHPQGYSDEEAGLMGAALLISGVVAAIVTAPIFDRYLTHHLALSAKCLVPLLAAAWIGVIFAVVPNNQGAIYALLVLIGISSFILLPVALELGCEVTRSAETSSSILWFATNLVSVIFVIVEDALREPDTASPPLNMRRSLIFSSSIIAITALSVFGLRGKQTRRELDAQKSLEVAQTAN